MRKTMLMALVVLTAGLCAHAQQPAPAKARPDFSGTWVFDTAKSMKPGPDNKIVASAIFGEECAITQDAKALSLAIKAGELRVNVVYKLDGTESRNMSPGALGQPDVPVTSKLSWEGSKLVIDSSSTSITGGKPVQVETRRTLWLDEEGSLMIERTGSKASGIIPTRGAYKKK